MFVYTYALKLIICLNFTDLETKNCSKMVSGIPLSLLLTVALARAQKKLENEQLNPGKSK